MALWGIVKTATLVVQIGLAGAASAAETTTYTYDALGRLTVSANTGGPRSGVDTSTGFDPAGNRAVQAVGMPASPPANAATVSIGNAAAVNGGQSAIFTVTKSGTASSALSTSYSTADGSAVAPADYAATSGVLTFLAWETVKTIPVATVARTGVPARQFTMSLSSPSAGLTIGTGTATAAINANGPANQPPNTQPDVASVGTCRGVTVDVVANDTDPENNTPLVVLSAGPGTLGSVTLVGTTSVRFAAFGGEGRDVFSYTVRDSLGATSTGSVDITVNDLGGCN